MGSVLELIKLNWTGILILVCLAVLFTVVLVSIRYFAESKVLYCINMAEETIGKGLGNQKKNYVLSMVYTKFPWLRVIFNEKSISNYIDTLVGVANKIYDLSKNGDSTKASEKEYFLTEKEIKAIKDLAVNLLTNNDYTSNDQQ
jgi:hypothetical protein